MSPNNIYIKLPNGQQVDGVPCNTTIEQARQMVQSSGLGNVAGAPATVDQAGNITFGEPAGGRKAL